MSRLAQFGTVRSTFCIITASQLTVAHLRVRVTPYKMMFSCEEFNTDQTIFSLNANVNYVNFDFLSKFIL